MLLIYIYFINLPKINGIEFNFGNEFVRSEYVIYAKRRFNH